MPWLISPDDLVRTARPRLPSRRFSPDFLFCANASYAQMAHCKGARYVNSTGFDAWKYITTEAGIEVGGVGTYGLPFEWDGSFYKSSSDDGTGDVTMLVYGIVKASAAITPMLAIGDVNDQAFITLAANFDASENFAVSGQMGFGGYGGGYGGANAAGAIDDRLHVWAGRRRNSNNISLWRDGVSLATATTTRPDFIAAGTAQRITLFNRWSAGDRGAWSGQDNSIAIAAIWNRALSDAELAELGRSPWLLFEQPRRRTYFAQAGGGSTYSETLSESVTATDLWANVGTLAGSLAEAITAGDALANAAVLEGLLTEAATADDQLGSAPVVEEGLSEIVAPSDALAHLASLAGVVAEAATCSEALASTATIFGAVSETIVPSDSYSDDTEVPGEPGAASDWLLRHRRRLN